MRSTLGKVSAIMILLAFIIASILVLNIVKAQNDTVNNTNNSVNVLENVIINDAVDNGTVSEDFVLGSEISQNIPLTDTVEIVTSVSNDTSNETSQEESNETSEQFVVSIGYSERITRGESTVLNADAINTGSLARNVYLEWMLPEGFEIVSGNLRKECGNLDKDASCYSEISVMIDSSVEIGLNEVKIVVNYEK